MGVSRALRSESDHLRDLFLAHPAARVPPFPGSWGPLGAGWLPTERTDSPQEHGHLWAEQDWDGSQGGLRVPGNTWSPSPFLLDPGGHGNGGNLSPPWLASLSGKEQVFLPSWCRW